MASLIIATGRMLSRAKKKQSPNRQVPGIKKKHAHDASTALTLPRTVKLAIGDARNDPYVLKTSFCPDIEKKKKEIQETVEVEKITMRLNSTERFKPAGCRPLRGAIILSDKLEKMKE